MPEVGADAAAEVSHEVVAAGVIRASQQCVAVEESIETKIFAADACHQFCRNILADPWCPQRVEVIKDRPVGLITAIKPLACPPVNFALDAEPVVHQQVGTEPGIRAAALARKEQAIRCGWRP